MRRDLSTSAGAQTARSISQGLRLGGEALRLTGGNKSRQTASYRVQEYVIFKFDVEKGYDTMHEFGFEKVIASSPGSEHYARVG
jgi:hypothetical protein